MEFRPIASHDYEAVRQLLCEAGWQHRIAEPEKFQDDVGQLRPNYRWDLPERCVMRFRMAIFQWLR